MLLLPMVEVQKSLVNQKKSFTVQLASLITAIAILYNVLVVLKPAGPASFLKYLVSFALSSLAFLLTCRKSKDFRTVTVLIVVSTLIWFVQDSMCTIWSKPTRYQLTSMLIVYFNILLTYVVYKVKLNVIPIKIIYYIIASYFLYQLLIAGVSSLDLFFESSGALLGALIVSLAVLITYIDYRDNKRMKVFPWFIAILLSALSMSRTALLCATVSFLGFLYFKINIINKKIVRYFLFVFVLSSLAAFVYIFWDYFMYMEIASKFQEQSMDLDGRDVIWSAYFDDFDIKTIMIGKSIDESNTLAGFDNPHNSYIRFHSNWGFFSIMGILFIIYCLVRLLVKKKFYYAFLSLILLALGFSNIVFFFGFYDYVLYALILEGLNKKDSLTLPNNKLVMLNRR